MRYDNLLRAIERATVRYESEVQGILKRFSKADGDTNDKILASLTPRSHHKLQKKAKRAYKKKHWTQKPENKARVLAQMKKAKKASLAKKRAIQKANAEHDNG
jgi:hypothetical protein